jgi:hypothetical protein
MCPFCIGSAVLALTSAGSAGGLAIIVARVAGASTAAHTQDSRAPGTPTDQMTPADGASAGNPNP